MKKILIDMHNHDIRSDGENYLDDFARKAIDLKLDGCALTNHDIIDRDLKKILDSENIIVPEAVEISTQNYKKGRSLHLTAYSSYFKDELDLVLSNTINGKRKMLEMQVKKLSDLGFNINFDGFLNYFLIKGKKSDSLNKYSIAYYLFKGENKDFNINFLDKKYGENYGELPFYINFLKKGGKYFDISGVRAQDYEPSIEKTGELVKNSNGILSIAHPNFTFKKGIEEFEKEIIDYLDIGVNAIELNPKASKEWIESIFKIKQKYDLILTFGSDCHSIGKIDDKHGDFGTMINIDNKIIRENFELFRKKINI